MPWYWFKRGGWEMAVDAVSLQDARQYIKRHAFGAVYQGEATPPTWPNTSMATGMITERRQEIISAKIRHDDEEYRRQNP